MTKPVLDKVCWIHCKDRRVLFVRSKGIDLAYTVGGKIEPGETHEQALIREVKEEVDVDLKPETIEYIGTVNGQAYGKYEGWDLRLHCYIGEYDGELKVKNEIAEDGMVWLATADVATATDLGKTTTTGDRVLNWLCSLGYID